jgi:hypothetical protein
MTADKQLKPVVLPHPSRLLERDWFLFDEPRSPQAAAELTQALIKAIAAPSERAAWTIIWEVMEKWSDCGACDTEPRGVADDYIEAAFNNRYPGHYTIGAA